MRYTGHLDLYRTWERTMRRARLPLAYTQGFRPHPRINLASALPLGFTGQGEMVDIWLEQDLPVDQIEERLRRSSPPGVEILNVEAMDSKAPTLQTLVDASEFTVTFLDPLPELDARLNEVLAAGVLPRRRRGKDYDLRPLIQSIERLPDDEAGRQRLRLRLSAREGATGRPEEVILALGGVPEAARVHRERLIFSG
jgi:radical SAM-linked protein